MQYPAAALKKAPGFDHQLHSHLLDLRNRLIAHEDYGALPPTMYLQTIGDEKLPVSIGINAKSMAGIHSRSLAERYQAHFKVCMTAIEEALNGELKELVAQARKYPAEFDATHNVPGATAEIKIAAGLADLPGPTGPASDVPEPAFAEKVSGYRYLTLRHEMALVRSGTYTIHHDGVPTQMEFEVSGSSFPPPESSEPA